MSGASRRDPGLDGHVRCQPHLSSALLERYDVALTHLGEPDRLAIIFRVELGLAWPDVATLLRKPSAPAAKVAVTRALVRLAREMSS